VALQKARALRKAGGLVTVVSPDVAPGFKRLRVRSVRRRFRPGDVRGARLVIAATDDPTVNARIHRICSRRGILVNVVDVPHLCSFIVPSVVRRGPVTLAISTDGESPSLAKALRKDLERLYPSALGPFAQSVGKARRRILRALPPSRARNRLLQGLTRGLSFTQAGSR
jgi:siroheme synthase-like protein